MCPFLYCMNDSDFATWGPPSEFLISLRRPSSDSSSPHLLGRHRRQRPASVYTAPGLLYKLYYAPNPDPKRTNMALEQFKDWQDISGSEESEPLPVSATDTTSTASHTIVQHRRLASQNPIIAGPGPSSYVFEFTSTTRLKERRFMTAFPGPPTIVMICSMWARSLH